MFDLGRLRRSLSALSDPNKEQVGQDAENITTKGIDLLTLKPGSRISIGGEAILEITQLGKKCHTKCEIFKLVGECVMPTEGIFARVVNSGKIKNEDQIHIIPTGVDQ